MKRVGAWLKQRGTKGRKKDKRWLRGALATRRVVAAPSRTTAYWFSLSSSFSIASTSISHVLVCYGVGGRRRWTFENAGRLGERACLPRSCVCAGSRLRHSYGSAAPFAWMLLRCMPACGACRTRLYWRAYQVVSTCGNDTCRARPFRWGARCGRRKSGWGETIRRGLVALSLLCRRARVSDAWREEEERTQDFYWKRVRSL